MVEKLKDLSLEGARFTKGRKMKFYIIQNKEMPWGDYGDALCYGYLNEMGNDYKTVLETPELERTGPYIPELYETNSTKILAIDFIKDILESNDLKGIENYTKVIKKKIVKIDWKKWDLDAEDPAYYPASGEPEDYIEEGYHNEALADSMPEVFCLNIEKKYTLKEISDITDYDYTNLRLEETPSLDIFNPLNKLYTIVSERFKKILERTGVATVDFLEIKVI